MGTLLPAIAGDTPPFQSSKKGAKFQKSKFIGRLTMSSSKLPVWLIATTMLLSMGFVLYPQGPANAAKYCAQLRGATSEGHREARQEPRERSSGRKIERKNLCHERNRADERANGPARGAGRAATKLAR